MLPVLLLYAAAGALMTTGVFGGKHVLDVAHDAAAKERIRRQLRNERELVRDALETQEVRDEARRRGLDIDSLQKQMHDSADPQQQIVDVLVTVLRRHGMTPEQVRQALED